MNAIQTAYINALLADASYVEGIQKGEIRATDFTKRLTQSQADFLAANFTVLDSVETPHPLGSGFDATIWQIKAGSALAGANNENAGKIYVSMRGTQGAEDIADDVALAATGVPISQIVDMCNWWLRISTASGQQAMQIRYQKPGEIDPVTGALTQSYGYKLAVPVAGAGVMLANSSVAGVNGHSLGGYLATAFTRLFGANVQSVSTYNSAGFSNVAATNTQNSFDQIAQLIGANKGLGSFDAVVGRQTNYYADNGWSVTTNTWGEIGFLVPGFNQYGDRVALYQEDLLNGNPIANHSVYKQTDLLALGAALEKLDSTMTFARLNDLVKAGSNDMKASYEGVLDGLRRVLIDRNVVSTPTGDTDSANGTRKAYHELLKQLTDLLTEPSGTLKSLAGKLTLTLPTTSLATTAKTDFAAFLSLNALSPVVISTTDASAIAALKVTNPILSTAWTAGYSDNWYADRTTLLQAITKRNQLDITAPTPIVADSSLALDRVLDIQYLEAGDSTFKTLTAWNPANNPGGNGLTMRDRQLIRFGNDGANTLTGTDNKLGDRLYGGFGDDTLNGLSGDDYLEGGADADTLNGGADNDTLLGGSGADTYQFSGTWGSDTVMDSDGQGGIVINGVSITGGTKVEGVSNVWKNSSQGLTFTLTGSAGQQTLIISQDGTSNTLQIKGWQAGQLGLNLPTATTTPPTPQPGTFTLQGDQTWAGHATLLSSDLLANGSYAPGIAAPGSNDVYVAGGLQIANGSGVSWIDRGAIDYDGMAGNDLIVGYDKDDHLTGGAGNDLLFGGAGSDVINGGEGNDFIMSGEKVYAEGSYQLAVAGLSTWTQSGTQGPNNTNGWTVFRDPQGHLQLEGVVLAYDRQSNGSFLPATPNANDADVVSGGVCRWHAMRVECFAIKTVADYAYSTAARGRFGLKTESSNDTKWGVAA